MVKVKEYSTCRLRSIYTTGYGKTEKIDTFRKTHFGHETTNTIFQRDADYFLCQGIQNRCTKAT